jgi:hypothetical protein
MGFRNFQFAINLNASASFQTAGVLLERYPTFSLQAVFAGAPVGVVKLQVSNDLGGDVAVVNWNDIAGSSFPVSGPGVFDWNVGPLNFRWISVVYTFTSGTGSCTCTFNTNLEASP